MLYVHLWSADNPDHVSLSRINDLDFIICLSEMHKRRMLTHKVPPEKLIVIPNLIDTAAFLPLNVERKNHSIMYAGNIQKHKCLHILIDAFELVRQQVADAELHIYGTGLMCGPSEYEDQLRSEKCQGLFFQGYVEN